MLCRLKWSKIAQIELFFGLSGIKNTFLTLRPSSGTDKGGGIGGIAPPWAFLGGAGGGKKNEKEEKKKGEKERKKEEKRRKKGKKEEKKGKKKKKSEKKK